MPPGRRTLSADNAFYIGQLEVVTRISRAHTIWFDALGASRFQPALVEPAGAAQPVGTAIGVDYRGAFTFTPDATPFDASRLDAYGDLTQGSAILARPFWVVDPSFLDGARYLQVRLTFISNATDGTSPTLSALGLPFRAF
jgi:hypothetical protein